MLDRESELIVIGGGLAGCEAAWQAATRGVSVTLYEMRPAFNTGAHRTPFLAELVCSNSLGSNLIDRAAGLLKEELRRLNSMLLECAENTAVPAGGALAVDRDAFALMVSDRVESHPSITVKRQEVKEIPNIPTIVASGPLTSPNLSQAISELTGSNNLYFYDAVAPIVSYNSIDMDIAFRSSRFGKGALEIGDYINCPMSHNEYSDFIYELMNAERAELKGFERSIELGVKAGDHKYFEACLPIEVMANRGAETLAFGPMRPIGLVDPRTGKRPYAVVQLRQDNLAATLYNLVGFQTNLTISEQERVFKMIPGLGNADFVRYGQMHRNTFIFSPECLKPTLQYRGRDDLFFAGQITGVEGYMGNIASGLLAGINAVRILSKNPPLTFPTQTMLGALFHYITHASRSDFQPMKANYGLLIPPIERKRSQTKHDQAMIYFDRSVKELNNYLNL